MRVALDVTPLALTKAGVARHIAGLLSGLEAEPDLELRRYSFGGRSRALVPVRDLGWYLGALPTRAYSRALLPRVARAAARVIAVSEFTRRELVDLLDVPEDKVRVIPNAVGPPFEAEGKAADGDYVLAVGTLEPRKNLDRLVGAFERARLNGTRLLVTGCRGWGTVEPAGKSVQWLGFVPDEELARLYRGARCVAYVSAYEGFGLPVLEAMACGAPVVAARTGAAPEVAGEAAVLVDPSDDEAIAAGLVEAIDRADELRERGLRRARDFDWQRVADATVEVYREVAV